LGRKAKKTRKKREKIIHLEFEDKSKSGSK
jgi:hypothetical protein